MWSLSSSHQNPSLSFQEILAARRVEFERRIVIFLQILRSFHRVSGTLEIKNAIILYESTKEELISAAPGHTGFLAQSGLDGPISNELTN
jgi:hypothetical protein